MHGCTIGDDVHFLVFIDGGLNFFASKDDTTESWSLQSKKHKTVHHFAQCSTSKCSARCSACRKWRPELVFPVECDSHA